MPDSSPQRDSFRWTILGLIFVSHIIGASAQYGINTLAPFYKDEMSLSRAQIGLFFSAFYLAMTGASFGTGWLADRLGVRKTTLLGHLGLGVCTTAAAFSPSFESAWVSFFLAGFGYSFLNPASSIGVMTWFDRDERATAMGIKQRVFRAAACSPRFWRRRWCCSSAGAVRWRRWESSISLLAFYFLCSGASL